VSITIPAYELSLEKKVTFRVHVHQILVQRAIEKALATSRENLTIRDLSPEDLGLTSWATPAQAAYTTVEWIKCVIKPRQLIAIYKVLQLSAKPKVSTLTIYIGGSRVGSHELEPCYAGLPIIENLKKALMDPTTRAVLDRMSGREGFSVAPDIGSPMEGYFGEPYIIGPAHFFRVEVKARYRTSGDHLVLGGYIAERLGEIII